MRRSPLLFDPLERRLLLSGQLAITIDGVADPSPSINVVKSLSSEPASGTPWAVSKSLADVVLTNVGSDYLTVVFNSDDPIFTTIQSFGPTSQIKCERGYGGNGGVWFDSANSLTFNPGGGIELEFSVDARGGQPALASDTFTTSDPNAATVSINLEADLTVDPLLAANNTPNLSLTANGSQLTAAGQLYAWSFPVAAAQEDLTQGLYHSRVVLSANGVPFTVNSISYAGGLSPGLFSPDIDATVPNLPITLSSPDAAGMFDVYIPLGTTNDPTPSITLTCSTAEDPSFTLTLTFANILPPQAPQLTLVSSSIDSKIFPGTAQSPEPCIFADSGANSLPSYVNNGTNTFSVDLGQLPPSVLNSAPITVQLANSGTSIVNFPSGPSAQSTLSTQPFGGTDLFSQAPMVVDGILPGGSTTITLEPSTVPNTGDYNTFTLADPGEGLMPMSIEFSAEPYLPPTITDETSIQPLGASTAITFSNTAAGVIFADRSFHTFTITNNNPSIYTQNFYEPNSIEISSVSILGSGFISPDLQATKFPIDIEHTRFDAHFRVYAFAANTGTYNATLQIELSSPVAQVLDIPLSVTVDAPDPIPIFEADNQTPILQGQTVNLGEVAYTNYVSNDPLSVEFRNIGNAPFTFSSKVSAHFTPDPNQPSGGGGSGIIFGGVGPQNPFGSAEVTPTPGIEPGTTQQVSFDVPTRRTGVYSATAVVSTSVSNFTPVTFHVVARVARDASNYVPQGSGVSGTPQPTPTTGLIVTSISSTDWTVPGLPAGDGAGDETSPGTIRLANKGKKAFTGSVVLRLAVTENDAGYGVAELSSTLITLPVSLPARATINVPVSVPIPHSNVSDSGLVVAELMATDSNPSSAAEVRVTLTPYTKLAFGKPSATWGTNGTLYVVLPVTNLSAYTFESPLTTTSSNTSQNIVAQSDPLTITLAPQATANLTFLTLPVSATSTGRYLLSLYSVDSGYLATLTIDVPR